MRMLSALRWVLVAVIALVLLAPFALSAVTGLRTLEVDGGSMAPTYERGDLVVVDPARVETVAVGDVVTVRRPSGVLYTHRVEGVDADGQITTRGDANPVADIPAVKAGDILGVVTAHIARPWAAVIVAAQSLPGRVSLALVMVGLLVISGYGPRTRLSPAAP